MYSSKIRNQSLVEKKRFENHEKFNKEITQANYVLEQLLDKCNKMLTISEVIGPDNNNSIVEEKEKEFENEKTINSTKDLTNDKPIETFEKNVKNDEENPSKNDLENNYEDDFECYSAEFQGNIIENSNKPGNIIEEKPKPEIKKEIPKKKGGIDEVEEDIIDNYFQKEEDFEINEYIEEFN